MIYEYKCEDCDSITSKKRSIEERKEPCKCGVCGHTAKFIVSTPRFMFDPSDSGFAGNSG